MKNPDVTYKAFGKRAILVEWRAEIDENLLNSILDFKKCLQEKNTKVILDVITTYNSLTIFYKSTIENIYNEISTLQSIFKTCVSSNIVKKKLWKIPVCYDLEFGVDLKEVALKNNLDSREIIRRHSTSIYTLYFVGFLPGFLYLGGLDELLHFPRKKTPRLEVKKGSVGIGGSQTGIYPQDSAGGWNIIGNSPIQFFDRKRTAPCFAKPGDKVQFVPIDIHQHAEILNLVAYKRYAIESEVLDA